jgi:hypothetical protein
VYRTGTCTAARLQLVLQHSWLTETRRVHSTQHTEPVLTDTGLNCKYRCCRSSSTRCFKTVDTSDHKQADRTNTAQAILAAA